MTRRGQAEMIEWFPRLAVLLVALVIIALLVRFYTQRDVDAGETEIAAYLARLERDPAVYAWSDPATGRSTPGVIDAAKLTQGRLDAVFGAQGRISSKVNITHSCISEFVEYHDRETFDLTYALGAPGVLGPQSGSVRYVELPVTIVQGATRCSGLMKITVARPAAPRKVFA